MLLAHYGELDWVSDVLCVFPLYITNNYQASSFGIPFDLIRISVGLEDPADLCARVQRALDAVEKAVNLKLNEIHESQKGMIS